ncbi:hydroxyisourate hydrolase [Kyrpidia spormannii]|uniref:5-hydroxyisourate hydrolase also uricase subunit n=2 Tax=Kyrpidia spormannii TaxID=2055160 RepID=A0ACA8Z997_9BACL|nr:hydroxyisourate hydrolase [Kyrpidia spormannii]CAB3391372.1 5-hydroxyisourate hydrolase; also uricase subunit [Kyrpidia spormannii]CAB3392285.1 5-hydroxyisourate hydrolase; also uricase subunit [Kyrpidia spormannii]
MKGRLTTHVLDVACACPAAGLAVELFRVMEDGRKQSAARAVTGADGRLERPLLAGEAMRSGFYEIVFFPGDYYRGKGGALAEAVFFDRVSVSLRIADPEEDLHIPLLIAPGGYSVYRGKGIENGRGPFVAPSVVGIGF